MKKESIKILSKEDIVPIIQLTQQLNPNMSISELESRQLQMFDYENYRCFGFFVDDRLIGVTSGWITVRLYSGKQLEIDNVIMDTTVQSKVTVVLL